MTDEDLKKIKNVVKGEINSALEPIKETLNEHTEKLDSHTRILAEHTSKLDTHTASLVNIEATLGSYADRYKVNKEDNQRLKQRVERIEKRLVITPQD